MCVCVFTGHATPGILVPWPEIKPVPHAMEGQSPNHWTAREFPRLCISEEVVRYELYLSGPHRQIVYYEQILEYNWANLLPSLGYEQQESWFFLRRKK